MHLPFSGDLSAAAGTFAGGDVQIASDGKSTFSSTRSHALTRTGLSGSTNPIVSFESDNSGSLAEVASVRGDGSFMVGGTLPASPNITLNADGDIKLGRNCEFWTGTTPNGAVLFDTGASGGAGATVVRCFGTNGTGGGGVELVRNATSWGAFSQRSLKTALQPITDGLTKVSSLSAVTGRYKTDEEGASRSFLIADEVKQVLPEAVSGEGTDEDPLSLRYTEVIPLLVSALHDAKDRIEALEAKVQQLEGGTN